MKVFLAGASGAVGRQLVPMLAQAGHEVTGTTRSPERAKAIAAAGAKAAVLDALDERAVRAAVLASEPEVVIHQLTALPQRIDPRKVKRDFVLNDRLRGEGTRILVAAAREAGARKVVAQSIAFSYAPGPAGTLHIENDPLLTETAPSFERSARAVRELEQSVLGADGIVLRYGYFYGPGTAMARAGSMGQDLFKRRLPLVGGGSGVWSLLHIADAARAAMQAMGSDASGAFNVVDDHPARVSEWLPALAEAIGAPRPMKVPAWLARLAAGSYAVSIMTEAQGASNALAKRELGWTPAHPDWREGFRTSLG
ncbi:MAG TPA: NAD(P)-dependent oxidoreductase [Solirubrobacteraceae bacterium]